MSLVDGRTGRLYAATTFRTLGDGAVPQAIFALANQGDSLVRCVVRGLTFTVDTTVALATVACQVDAGKIVSIATVAAFAGTELTKTPMDADQASAARVLALGTTASDGGADTILAAPGTTFWRNFVERLHTAVGQVLFPPIDLLPKMAKDGGLVIHPDQALTVNITGTAGSNAATNHYIVNAIWQEEEV